MEMAQHHVCQTLTPAVAVHTVTVVEIVLVTTYSYS